MSVIILLRTYKMAFKGGLKKGYKEFYLIKWKFQVLLAKNKNAN